MKRNSMKLLMVLGVMVSVALQSAAETVKVEKGHTEFVAVGKPSAIKIRGQTEDLKSELQWKDKTLNGNFILNVDSLDTGIEMRTKHMNEKYLETSKYKNAELTLKPVAFTQDLCKESIHLEKMAFEGILKLHGVEKPVHGEIDLHASKGQGTAKVRFPLNITDHQIDIPVYMGIKVADKVDTTTDLTWSCVP